MYFCLIYNLNSSSGRKSKFINKILSKLKESNSVDYFETKTVDQAKKILENFNFLIENVKKEKPDTIKGEFIKNTFITSTMGISYKVGAK